tara:strand:- start:870 stop:1010 length:141 start_codon:yes stop_codon:yes gene_type:complete
VRFDDAAADDLFPGVVAALDEDVGQQIGYQRLDARAGEGADIIDTG